MKSATSVANTQKPHNVNHEVIAKLMAAMQEGFV